MLAQGLCESVFVVGHRWKENAIEQEVGRSRGQNEDK